MSDVPAIRSVKATLEIRGVQYKLRAQTLSGWDEIETQVRSRRGNPFDQISATKWERDGFLKAATDSATSAASRTKAVSISEIIDYRSTPEGAAFLFWIAVRDDHPEVKSHQQAANLLKQFYADYEGGWYAAFVEVLTALAKADGSLELGNSNGPEPDAVSGDENSQG